MRRRLAAILVFSTVLAAAADPAGSTSQAPAPPQTAIRFVGIGVFVDTAAHPLAAYQLDVRASEGDVKIAGIEGGEHAAFANPPYYDAAAMQQDHVIIAAFSTAKSEQLPAGRTRIATLHVQITGPQEPKFAAQLTVAATAGGAAIPAEVHLAQPVSASRN
jgi:hypothetical protein